MNNNDYGDGYGNKDCDDRNNNDNNDIGKNPSSSNKQKNYIK